MSNYCMQQLEKPHANLGLLYTIYKKNKTNENYLLNQQSLITTTCF